MVQQQICTLAQKPTQPSDLTLQVLARAEDFLRLRDQWDWLIAKSDADHPYVSHAWLSAWLDCFGAGQELRIFTVKSGDELVGAAPMVIRRTKMYGFPVSRLEAMYNCHTPRCEFPVIDDDPQIYRLLWQAMSDPTGSWDVVVLPQFNQSSPGLNILEDLSKQDGWLTGRWTGSASPFIRLDCDYDTLFNRLRTREQSNLRKRFNKLSTLGNVELEVITDPSQIKEAMRDGLRIEAAAWKGRAGTAMISDSEVERFYMQFAEREAEIGHLRLAFLRLDQQRIAFFYLVDYGGVLHAMKVGYDPRYRAYSPGHMLLMLILNEACDQGRLEFDFQGAIERWKLVWTPESRLFPWLFMFRDSWRPRLLHWAKFAVLPAVRRLSRTGMRRNHDV